MNRERKKELHSRFLKRELSKAELEEYFSMLKNVDENDLEEVETVSDLYPAEWDPARGKAKRMVRREVGLLRFRKVALSGMAAAFAIFVVISAVISYNQYSDYQKTQNFKYVKVGVGKMLNVKLEDGSVITLESGSVLKYPELFSKKERRVYLVEGRAFFKITKNKSWPFTVQSGKLNTTVLGTTFVIQNYKKYGYEKVSLYTGKVKITQTSNKGRSVIMNPGQEFESDSQKPENARLSSFDPSADPFGNGRLEFKNTAFKEAMYRIASYYGIKIRFEVNAFTNDFVSGIVNTSSPEELLNSLAFVNHFTITKINPSEYKLMKNKAK